MNRLKNLNVLASFLFLSGSIFLLEPTKFKYITPALFLPGSLCAFISNFYEKKYINTIGQFFFAIAIILQLIEPDRHESVFISLYIIGSFFLTIHSTFKIDPKKKLQYAFLNCGPFFLFFGSIIFFSFKNVGAILFIIGSFFYFFLEIFDPFLEEDTFDLVLVTAFLVIIVLFLIVFGVDFSWAFEENTSSEINCFIIVSTYLSLANNLPQLIHSYKETDSYSFKGFSILSYWIWLLGSVFWLIFAIGLQKTVLIINSCISIFSASFILVLIEKHK
jgi:hypothetical protein